MSTIDKLFEFTIEETDNAIKQEKKRHVIRFKDDGTYSDEEWNKHLENTKKYIQDKGYNKEYLFWTDGSNWLGEDHIVMMHKSLPLSERKGYGWSGPIWIFE